MGKCTWQSDFHCAINLIVANTACPVFFRSLKNTAVKLLSFPVLRMEAATKTTDLAAAPVLPGERQPLGLFPTGAAPEKMGDSQPQNHMGPHEPALSVEDASGPVIAAPNSLTSNGVLTADVVNEAGNDNFISTPVPLTSDHQEGSVTEPIKIGPFDGIWSPATKLKRRLEDTKDLIVCPGVYDGFSARIALSVGFDAMYMV